MSSLLQPARSDEQLTGAIAAGDTTAFDELYRRYARPLATYGARVLRDRSGGEDVAQLALTRAYQALRRGTEPLHVKPWLYKIALNTALEQRAKNGQTTDWEPDRHQRVAQETNTKRADILAAVQVLPERQRMVFFLREVQGLTVNEVAQRLRLDNQQVEQALFAARNRLAEELVFGKRVDCNLVRSLDPDTVTRFERRALKAHLRSCPSCRHHSSFGLSSLALSLKDAWHYLAGGGTMTLAKAGALAVTAGALGTAPITLPALTHKLLRHTHHARTGVTSPVATPSPQPQQIDRLNAIFTPPLLRPLLQPFATPPPQTPTSPPDPLTSPPFGPSAPTLDQQPANQAPVQTSSPAPTPFAPDASANNPTAPDTTADPNATDASATDPTTTDLSATDPSATDPSATDPTATDPTPTDPTATDPTATDPTVTDPSAADPTATDPNATASTATDTTATDTTTSP